MEEIDIIWFKRDIRSQDHHPLYYAQKNSQRKILAFYCFEKILENNYDFSLRHWQFIAHSLIDLNKKIPINVYYSDIENIFLSILKKFKINTVYSYQETGVDITYKRDKEIKFFLDQRNIAWNEYQNNGVIRGLKTRKNWDNLWYNYVKSDCINNEIHKERFLKFEINNLSVPRHLKENLLENSWHAGEDEAHKNLNNFLSERVNSYFGSISYPEKSRYYCSRLSPYISWGNLSIRQIYQECMLNKRHIKNKKSLDQFMNRLKWHCHFIQKFEMQEDIEFKNLNINFNQIRNKKNKTYIKRWQKGETGYPLVDAAMRCVQETGYLNFRLRAVVVSFLTHLLWQPWREGAKHLAKQFIDYEPGIHFSQFQMQAGTTGINTIRIYNPVKQSITKDKDAIFIKRWVPELKDLPTPLVHEPWNITAMEEQLYNFTLGKNYPKRIVDHENESKKASEMLWKLKKSDNTKSINRNIIKRHVAP